MTDSNRTIEDRLANYRQPLDEAILQNSAAPTSLKQTGSITAFSDEALIDVGQETNPTGSMRFRLLVSAAAVTAAIAGGLFAATKAAPDSITLIDTADATSQPDTTPPSSPTEATAYDPDKPIANPCPASIADFGPPATAYLGGPPSEQNRGVVGFIYSLPAGTPTLDVATSALGMPVTGLECGINGVVRPDGYTVDVTASPPGVPSAFTVEVITDELDGAIGVIEISGSTTVRATSAGLVSTVQIVGGAPQTAVEASVRFRKGEDVWELVVDPSSTLPIELAVPAGETDRYPDESVDWVLITLLDNDRRVVDVSGTLVR